jgi:hypothetical protein
VASPTDVTNLQAWYKADSITPVADSTPITTWADSSGNGFTASAGGGTPVYLNNAVNGLPTLNAGGGEWYTVNVPSDPSACTMFMVYNPLINGANVHAFFGSTNDGGLEWRTNEGVPELIKQFQAVIGSGTTGVTTAAWRIQTVSFTNTSNYAFYLNGTANGSGTHSVTLATGGTSKIIRGSLSGPEPYAGNFAELIIYNRVLTTGERATVHTYLQDKYAITVSDYATAAVTRQRPTTNRARLWAATR